MTPGEMADRIEAAEGPNYALECEIEETFGVGRVPPPNVTYSLDAAVAFVERVIPGAVWHVDNDPCASVWRCRHKGASPDEGANSTGKAAKTPAMALVAAALRALQGAADGGAG